MPKTLDRETLQTRIAQLLKVKFEFDHAGTSPETKTWLLLGSDFTEAECLGAALLLNAPVTDMLRFQRDYRDRMLDALLQDMSSIGTFGKAFGVAQ